VKAREQIEKEIEGCQRELVIGVLVHKQSTMIGFTSCSSELREFFRRAS
jgi:hypothetical protein